MGKYWWDYLTSPSGVPNTAGKVFFVDAAAGLDTNVGDVPTAPLQTFVAALAKCVSGRGDYIFVLNAGADAMPIILDKTRVHVIGLSGKPQSLVAAADTAVFQVSSNSNDCEIANFRIRSGATHAGIENIGGTPMGLYIHDCWFGHSLDAGAMLHGIWIRSNATALQIKKCRFFGTNAGRITGDGIRFDGMGDSLQGVIEDCLFNEIPGVGIRGNQMIGFEILLNRFGYPVDNAGAAITLAANCHRNVIVGNNANVGKAVAGAVIAYVDGAADNHWSGNLKAGLLNLPA